MNTQRAREYVRLTREKRAIEKELKVHEEQISALESALLDDFEREGVTNLKIDGATIYPQLTVWARPKDQDWATLCTRLREHGEGTLIEERVNVHTLSAWVRENRDIGIPEPVRDALEITNKPSLRVRAV